MDQTARKTVNLSVLRRHDQSIVEIVDSSSYVVVYKFDKGAWVCLNFTHYELDARQIILKHSNYGDAFYFHRQKRAWKAHCLCSKGMALSISVYLSFENLRN